MPFRPLSCRGEVTVLPADTGRIRTDATPREIFSQRLHVAGRAIPTGYSDDNCASWSNRRTPGTIHQLPAIRSSPAGRTFLTERRTQPADDRSLLRRTRDEYDHKQRESVNRYAPFSAARGRRRAAARFWVHDPHTAGIFALESSIVKTTARRPHMPARHPGIIRALKRTARVSSELFLFRYIFGSFQEILCRQRPNTCCCFAEPSGTRGSLRRKFRKSCPDGERGTTRCKLRAK